MKTRERMRMAVGILAVFLIATACSAVGPTESGESGKDEMTWQDYYDLGVRYISEGNYEEAIIAFTSAIEIDPKQALAYVGRGDSYANLARAAMTATSELNDQTSEGYKSAVEDYLTAIGLDNTQVDVYLKAAKVYEVLGDTDSAIGILQQGILATGGDRLKSYMIEISKKEEQVSGDESEPWGTKNFDDFTSEQQQLVMNLVQAIKSGEHDKVQAELSAFIDVFNREDLSFTLDEYHVCMNTELFRDGAGGHISLHPCNGQGFDFGYVDAEDGSTSYSYVLGECREWNWNGEFEGYSRIFIPDQSDTIVTRSGYARDGLVDGDETRTQTTTYVGESAEWSTGWEKTWVEHFDMGVHPNLDGIHSVTGTYPTAARESRDWDWSLPRT